MAQGSRWKLTDAQLKGLDDAERVMTRAFDDARKVFGGGVPGDGDFSCLICSCAHFQGQGTGLQCKQSGCGHSFFRHAIW